MSRLDDLTAQTLQAAQVPQNFPGAVAPVTAGVNRLAQLTGAAPTSGAPPLGVPAYSGEPDLPLQNEFGGTGTYGDTGKVATDAINAAWHNLQKPFHNLAMGVENATQWAANKLPDNTVSRAISNTADSDRAALAQWEAEYQKNQPTGLPTNVGATIGAVAPFIAGGGALNAAGQKVAADATALPAVGGAILRSPMAQKVISGATQGVLAAPAITPGGTADYGTQTGKNAAVGAIAGGSIPIIGGALGWAYDQAKGVLQPLFSKSGTAVDSLAGLRGEVENAAGAAPLPANQAPTMVQGPPAPGAPQIPGAAPGAAPTAPGVAPAPENFGALRAGAPQIQDPVPGVQRTVVQAMPTAETAAAEKVIRNTPEGKVLFAERDAQNNAARWAQLNQFTGQPADLAAAKAARDTATAPLRAQVFQNPVDPQPVLDQLAQLKMSSLGADPQVAGAIGDLEKSIDLGRGYTQTRYGTGVTVPGMTASTASDGYVAPDLMDAYRQNVRAFLARHETNGIVGSQQQAAFGPVKDAITASIEGANPGYRDYLAQYAKLSQPINSMEAANSVRDYFANRPLDVGRNPFLTLSGFNTALDRAQNLDYGLSPEANQAFEGIRQSLQNETLSNAIRTAGSDTAYNLRAPSWLSGKLLGPDLEGGVAGKVPIVGGIAKKIAPDVNTIRAQILMDPERFMAIRSAAAQNPLQQSVMSQALMRGAPAAASNLESR
jgi:hypothetical protein